MRAWLLALALLAAPLAGCASQPASDPAQDSDQAPQWSFTDTEGTEHSTDSASGSPTVVFYMATWCSSCKSMTTEMAQVHEEHASQGVDVFSVAVDPGEGDEDLESWKAEYDQPWPHGVDEGSQMQRAYGVDSQSSVVVLDAEGSLVEGWGYGEATAEDVSQAIEAA